MDGHKIAMPAEPVALAAPKISDKRRTQQRLAILITAIGVLVAGWVLANMETYWESFSQLRTRGGEVTQRRAEIEVRFNQGAAMLHLKEYEHAITAFHRVLQLAPGMPEAHANMGFAMLGQGRDKAAADFFSAALSLKVDQWNAYYGLALALAAQGKFELAIGAMRTFVHRAKSDDTYRLSGVALIESWRLKLDQAQPTGGSENGLK